MSISYIIYDLEGNYIHSIEDWRMSRLIIFCKVMGLPTMPMNWGSFNESYWNIPGGKNSVMLPAKKEKIHSVIRTSYKSLKMYAHWKKWGINKLSQIKLEDLQGRFKMSFFYETEDDFEEIKEDILMLLDDYTSASYYRLSF